MEAVENCQNCRKPFPVAKIDSHFSYCRRNIRKCAICPEMVDINHLEEHMEDAHSKEQCQWCLLDIASQVFESHKKSCQSRPIVCAYCEQSVPPQTFDQHQQQCGSRTKSCPLCNKSVLMRDYCLHEATCTGAPQEPSPATVKVYANYNEYIRQNRQRYGIEQKEQTKPPTRTVIERIRINPAELEKKSSGEPSSHKHQIKELGSRVIRISEPRALNKEDEGISYEPRSATVIRSTTTARSYPEVVTTRVTVVQPQVQQYYGFEEEDAELQRALLQSMGHM